MHKLDRSAVPAPKFLSGFQPARKWTDLSSKKKRQIQIALANMQKSIDSDGHEIVRCAYCEVRIVVPNPPDGIEAEYENSHIEHFRTRKDCPQLTFDWNNLFLSCTISKVCGKYKDEGHEFPYAPEDLIKPDVDDPDLYLHFSSTGEVLPRDGLDAQKTNRAKETIRVLRLDDPTLIHRRQEVLSSVLSGLQEFMQIPGVSDDELALYCQEEVQAREWEPFSSAIKSVLIG